MTGNLTTSYNFLSTSDHLLTLLYISTSLNIINTQNSNLSFASYIHESFKCNLTATQQRFSKDKVTCPVMCPFIRSIPSITIYWKQLIRRMRHSLPINYCFTFPVWPRTEPRWIEQAQPIRAKTWLKFRTVESCNGVGLLPCHRWNTIKGAAEQTGFFLIAWIKFCSKNYWSFVGTSNFSSSVTNLD